MLLINGQSIRQFLTITTKLSKISAVHPHTESYSLISTNDSESLPQLFFYHVSGYEDRTKHCVPLQLFHNVFTVFT